MRSDCSTEQSPRSRAIPLCPQDQDMIDALAEQLLDHQRGLLGEPEDEEGDEEAESDIRAKRKEDDILANKKLVNSILANMPDSSAGSSSSGSGGPVPVPPGADYDD
eukprot:4852549-Pyramimonas_sp.AAC.1